MKLARTFYQLTAALAVLSIESVYGTDQTISLSLQVGTYEKGCSGGDGGLTNTSIEVQSRLLQGSSVVSEWCILTVIDPKQGFNDTLNIHYNGSFVNGIQLKLLQLEPGGGDCNCWMVEDATIFMESSSVRLFGLDRYAYCSHKNNQDQNKFCGDADTAEARGFISKAASIPVNELHSPPCPAQSYNFSVATEHLPKTCMAPRNAETSISEPSAKISISALIAETSTGVLSAETSTGAPSVEISSLSSVMILNMLSSSLDEYNLPNHELKLILDALEVVIDKGHNATEVSPDVIGSSLLSFVDRLALAAFQNEDNITSANEQIFIQTRLISADVENYITTIKSEDYSNYLPLMSIEIPSELIGLSTCGGNDEIRVISALYYDVEHLFSGERSGEKSSALGSGIVSTGLQCGESLCDTTEISLSYPVVITFKHFSESIVVSECVFWKFLTLSVNTSLTSGIWSNEGCFVNAALSNSSFTVCECYHLTHFAILLSPVSLTYNQEVEFSLQVIGYIGVAVSVVAMAITAITFISLKSLHNIRSYIHIHLCINLMIAQLIFVVGIDKSAEDHVPVHCQVIAVLLHYFFLVSFMWMLMEGVVLYLILICVFVTNTKKYIVSFTLASYGIPFLYLGLLTLPLGYTFKDQHYGSNLVCFLNAETNFIWAFISPVILIIFLNIGFLIMAAVALWRQKKSQKGEMDRRSITAWLRFLVVVMGITWLVGVLVLEVKALLPLAYIFTIMVAFQGVAIFLSLVAFQKSVRDEYIKWFRRQRISKYFAKSPVSTSTSFAFPKGNEGI